MAFALSTATNDVRAVIEARLLDQWATGGTQRTPIQFPGVLGLRDINGAMIRAPRTEEPWIKLDILWGSTDEATFSLGCSLNRTVGIIQLSVYCPANQGAGLLETYKGFARSIFSRYVGGGLYCRASSPGPNFAEAGWTMGVISTAFEFFEDMEA